MKRIIALGMVMTMIFGCTLPAVGEEKSITVSSMAMTVNGVSVTPTKSDGAVAEVFAYDGDTYVPLNYLSGLLDIKVNQDANDAGTVNLVGDNLKTPLAENTFIGEGMGRNGAIQVEVTMKDEKIENVTVKNHSETSGIADPALENTPKAIVQTQSLTVDAVAGATLTHQGIVDAVENALVQAGVDVEEWKKPVDTTPIVKSTEKLECEIVVVGGGGTGLAAAASALDHGAKNVIVLEKMPALGGSVNRAGGALAAAGTKYQKAASIVDTTKAWVDYWIDDQQASNVESQYPDRSRLESLANEAVEVVEWVGDTIGLHYATPRPFGWGGPCRAHAPAAAVCPASGRGTTDGGGAILVEAFSNYLDGQATIMTETTGTKLITDANGNVIGVHAEGNTADYDIYAQSVVLATGGFAKNAEMLEEYIPNTSYYRYTDISWSGVGSTGDGIRMALDVGAELYEDPWIIGMTVSAKDDTVSTALTTVNNLKESCFVDQTGCRFGREDVSYPTSSIASVDTAWSIIGSADATRAAILASGLDGVEVVTGNTWEELAKEMDVDPDTLKATMEKYNLAAKTGEDTEFGKEAPYIVAVDKAPFYAVRVYPVTAGTLGGVKTNADFQVLDAEGSVIKGLYAGGECSNKVFYNQVYTSGSGLTIAMVSGYTIGRAAAEALE